MELTQPLNHLAIGNNMKMFRLYHKIVTICCCVFLAWTACLSLNAQTTLSLDGPYMYAEASIHQGGRCRTIKALIDTGCTTCVVDSTFAADSLGIVINSLTSIDVNTSSNNLQQHIFILDSLSFCGLSFHGRRCIVSDLKRQFKQYAPNFIVGANVLGYYSWMFDMRNKVIKPLDIGKRTGGSIIKFKFDNYGRPIIKCKVNGIKTDMIFDTGARHCKLKSGIYKGATNTIMKETANLAKELTITEAEKCSDVLLEVGNYRQRMDFVIDPSIRHCLLNIDLFHQSSFILDYKKKVIEILKD